MKTATILGSLAAVCVFGLMTNSPASEPEERAVVSSASTALLFDTPRVRVTNDRNQAVVVSYLILDSGRLGELGSVPGLTTSTFTIPKNMSIQLVVQPLKGHSVPFVSEPVWASSKTDVTIQVNQMIDRSTFTLGELDVVRGATR